MIDKLIDSGLKYLDNETSQDSIELTSEISDFFSQELPGISIPFKTRKMYLGFKEKKFLRKLTIFIKDVNTDNLSTFNWEDREFNNKLITVVDRVDFEEKLSYLSKLFELYAKGGIKKDLFFRCCKILEHSSYLDIDNFSNQNYEVGDLDGPLYLSIGLLENELPKRGQTISIGSIGMLKLSEAGKVFVWIKENK